MEPSELASILTEAIQIKFDRQDPGDYTTVREERHWFLSKNKTEIEILSPSVFYYLRNFNNVSTSELIEEWGTLTHGIDVHGRPKSKSYLMFSRTKRFIMKTISRDESVTLRHMLPHYVRYCSSNPRTFLNRYLLLVKIHKKCTIAPYKGYVIVICNTFAASPEIHEIYDLKGRSPKVGGILPSKRSSAERRRNPLVMEDKNLVRSFSIDPQSRITILQQLKADFQFLQSQYLMDYSILLGVKQVKTENFSIEGAYHDKEQINKTFFESTDGSELYFIGVIDTLTYYGIKKRLSNFFKSLVWNQDTLSTVRPDVYYERLLAYSEAIFVS